MPYGDTVAPRIFSDQTPRGMTMVEFFRTMSQAFIAMGFKPLPSWGQLFQDAPVEAFTLDDSWAVNFSASAYGYHRRMPALFFDFPADVPNVTDTSGVVWKPVLELRYELMPNSEGYRYTQNLINNHVTCDVRLRRVDTNPATHWYAQLPGSTIFNSARKARALDNLYHNFGDVDGSSALTTYFPAGAGNSFRPLFWQYSRNSFYAGTEDTGSGSIAARTRRFAIRNIQILLSPAGFLLQVGSGTRKSDNNNILNLGLVFTGNRVPGRGIPSASDQDLAKTCPFIFHVFGGSLNTDNDANDTAAFNYRLNGITYFANFTRSDGTQISYDSAIKCRTFCLENLDLMDRAVRDRMAPLDSPRSVGGVVRHVLSPLVHTTLETIVTPVVFLAPTFSTYTTSYPLTRWRDAYFTARFVVTDSSAPGGVFPDPTSGRDYHMFRAQANGAMFGMDVTGFTPAVYTPPAHTLLDTTDIVTSSGTLVSSGPVSIVETGHSGSWTYPGTGVIQHVWTTGEVACGLWTFNVDADPLDRFYVLEFEYQHRGTTAADGPLLTEVATQREQYFNNPLVGFCRDSPAGSYQNVVGDILGCAGTNAADVNYNYRVVRLFLRRTTGVTKNILFQFIPDYYSYPGGGGSKTILIRNVKLRRYQFNY